jgi:predicted ATP-dependent endonuclease of OLD family
MLIEFVEVRNFRKLKSCRIDFSKKETVFVGANNSGKTTAMDALRFFLKEMSKISTREFTLSNWIKINAIGKEWLSVPENSKPNFTIDAWEDYVPQLDIWLKVESTELHFVNNLIPTLDWDGNRLGVRLRFEPRNIETLYKDFVDAFNSAHKLKEEAAKKAQTKVKLDLWPNSLWDFLEKKLSAHFEIKAYLLDATKLQTPTDGVANPQKLLPDNLPLSYDPFKGLIKIDIINAQRGFSDPNTEDDKPAVSGNLSAQLREYYRNHLNPYDQPAIEDLKALEAMETAKSSFDEKLEESFSPSLKELELLNYPGFGGNPTIKISSRINAIDGLNHSSAVQFNLLKDDKGTADHPLSLPEKYNGLGYQNLISMVFKLIRFRDEWMRVGKKAKAQNEEDEAEEFQPLHLVLVEEPEAHLHSQVQQVFIKKAYEVLRFNGLLEKHKHFKTQLVVSTHSNHIAHEIDFTSLRYFKRKTAEKENVPTSTVVNLSQIFSTDDEATKFAIRYLKTTHCDLFFADAVILIEGQAERILLPHFIRHYYRELDSCYIALLEIGGSHSFTLKPLLEALGINTLIITDIDSIDPKDSRKSKLPEKNMGYESANNTLRTWLPNKILIDDLLKVSSDDKNAKDHPFRVAYQNGINVKFKDDQNDVEVIPYTFEIALAYKNAELFKTLNGKGLIKKFATALNLSTAAEVNKELYASLSDAKKADFALELLFIEDPTKLNVPDYMDEGLKWLSNRLIPPPVTNPN